MIPGERKGYRPAGCRVRPDQKNVLPLFKLAVC